MSLDDLAELGGFNSCELATVEGSPRAIMVDMTCYQPACTTMSEYAFVIRYTIKNDAIDVLADQVLVRKGECDD